MYFFYYINDYLSPNVMPRYPTETTQKNKIKKIDGLVELQAVSPDHEKMLATPTAERKDCQEKVQLGYSLSEG